MTRAARRLPTSSSPRPSPERLRRTSPPDCLPSGACLRPPPRAPLPFPYRPREHAPLPPLSAVTRARSAMAAPSPPASNPLLFPVRSPRPLLPPALPTLCYPRPSRGCQRPTPFTRPSRCQGLVGLRSPRPHGGLAPLRHSEIPAPCLLAVATLR
nr:proline-rich protein 36-like [Aegilops tauschii subsp. strangulata]